MYFLQSIWIVGLKEKSFFFQVGHIKTPLNVAKYFKRDVSAKD